MARTQSKISPEKFVKAVEELSTTIICYKKGRSGENGECDCIGLVIGALLTFGIEWPGTHGTNWAWRNAMSSKGVVDKFEVGMVVYKAYAPEEGGWDLPGGYAKDPDQRDYYHVGVVISVDPLVIIHCSTGGIHRDASKGKWKFGGFIKWVDADLEDDQQEEAKLKTAIVTAPSGSTVNLRSAPSIMTGKLIDRLPVGSLVDVLEDSGEWMKISKGGKTGYMMSNYLEYSDAPDETAEIPAFDIGDLRHTLAEIAQLVNDLIGKVG